MTVVDLSPRLFEQMRWIARWQKVTADELAARALSSYLDRLEWEKLQAEMDAFQGQLPALAAQYQDEYVAMHEGQVIDHDPDLRTLHSRVYAVMGSVPVLLQKVTDVPAPDILVRRHRPWGAVRLAGARRCDCQTPSRPLAGTGSRCRGVRMSDDGHKRPIVPRG